jgi:uncharacterized phiE125 gp8 family phage protein
VALKLVTAPAAYPFSVEEAKAHLRVDFDDDDDLIEAMLRAAIDSAERFTGRAFVEQTWDYFLDTFPADRCSPIQIPNPPLLEIEGVFYRDNAGNEQEFNAAGYVVDDASEKARIALPSSGSWPSIASRINAVRIRFRAGYVTDDSPALPDVPAAIQTAIKMMLGTLYEHRESVVIGQTAVEMPWAAKELLRQYRVHTAMA